MATKLKLPELEHEWATWKLPKLSRFIGVNPRTWIDRIDRCCQTRGIPVSQRAITTIYFLEGFLKVDMKSVKAHLKSQKNLPSCNEKWEAFKNAFIGESECCLFSLVLI
jgi:hypothetical protein